MEVDIENLIRHKQYKTQFKGSFCERVIACLIAVGRFFRNRKETER